MTTLTYCTYTVKVRDLATIATLGRKVRPRGGRRTTATGYRTAWDTWRDHILLRGCVAYAGSPDETFISYVIGEQRDSISVPVPYDIIAAAVKGRRNETVIIHSDGRLECEDDTVYTWQEPRVVDVPIDTGRWELSHVASMAGDAFRHMVRVTVPSASSDDTRPTLTGVCLTTSQESVQAAATDSYRLTVCECDAYGITEDGVRTLIHARALSLAASVKCDAYDIERGADHVRIAPFVAADPLPHPLRIYTRRMAEDGYPPVDKLWPEGFVESLSVDTNAFVAAMRAANDAAKGAPVMLHIEESHTMRVVLKHGNVGGEWSVPATSHVTEPMMIGVNAAFALDAANAVGGDELVLSVNSPLKPMLFESVEPGVRSLVMPVRL